MALLLEIIQAIWFIFPAYAANAFPAVIGGKKPLDFNKNFGKNRLLGDSKTIEGTISGVIFGIFIGLVQMNFLAYAAGDLGLLHFTVPVIALLSTGALAGDVVGSFLKRRAGISSGEPAVILDQLGFLVAALAFVSFVYIPSFITMVILIILTPIIHILTNVVGYALGLKKYPW